MVKKDLRFRRTEKSLHSAILSLLQSKDYEQITVTDICEEAMCSRNAFYQHYDTKDDLFQSIADSVIKSILEGCRPVVSSLNEVTPMSARRYTDNLLAAIYKQKDDLKLLLGNKHLLFYDQIRSSIINETAADFEKISKDPTNKTEKAYSLYIISGIVGFAEYCITEADLSLAQAQDLLGKVTLSSIMVMIGSTSYPPAV